MTLQRYLSRIPIIDGGKKIPAGAMFAYDFDRPYGFHVAEDGQLVRVLACHLDDQELFEKAGEPQSFGVPS